MQLDEPFREELNNPRARIRFKRRTFEIITSLEKFYVSDQFLSQFLPLHSVFSLGSPLSFLVLSNLTSRIISGNERKQVSVYRRLLSKNLLNRLIQENITVKEFRKETTAGKLACLEFSEDNIKATEAKMHDL